jgi:hypothetical protein
MRAPMQPGVLQAMALSGPPFRWSANGSGDEGRRPVGADLPVPGPLAVPAVALPRVLLREAA